MSLSVVTYGIKLPLVHPSLSGVQYINIAIKGEMMLYKPLSQSHGDVTMIVMQDIADFVDYLIEEERFLGLFKVC